MADSHHTAAKPGPDGRGKPVIPPHLGQSEKPSEGINESSQPEPMPDMPKGSQSTPVTDRPAGEPSTCTELVHGSDNLGAGTTTTSAAMQYDESVNGATSSTAGGSCALALSSNLQVAAKGVLPVERSAVATTPTDDDIATNGASQHLPINACNMKIPKHLMPAKVVKAVDDLCGSLIETHKISGVHREWKQRVQAHDLRVKQAVDHNSTCQLLCLPGEIFNHILGYLVDGATYEMKFLAHQRHMTCWKYRTGRTSLDPHMNHGLERREKSSMHSGDDVTSWATTPYSPHFTAQFIPALASVNLTIPRRDKFRYGRRLWLDPTDEPCGSPGPTSWLMTCRKIYYCGVPNFYSKSAFSFGSLSLLRFFMRGLRPATGQWMRTMYLSHVLPGWTTWTIDMVYSDRNMLSFKKRLSDIITLFPNLEDLTLYLVLRPVNPDLDLDSEWIKTILPLYQLHLEHFNVALRSGSKTDENDDNLGRCRDIIVLLVTLPVLAARPRPRSHSLVYNFGTNTGISTDDCIEPQALCLTTLLKSFINLAQNPISGVSSTAMASQVLSELFLLVDMLNVKGAMSIVA